jgi:hypothetical protein
MKRTKKISKRKSIKNNQRRTRKKKTKMKKYGGTNKTINPLLEGDDKIDALQKLFSKDISRINEDISKIKTQLKLCCDDYDTASTKIQSAYKGNKSRRDTRRSMTRASGESNNITQTLLDMPSDFDHKITDYMDDINRVTQGWIKIHNADAWPNEFKKEFSFGHVPEHHIQGSNRKAKFEFRLHHRKIVVPPSGYTLIARPYPNFKDKTIEEHCAGFVRSEIFTHLRYQTSSPDELINNTIVSQNGDVYVRPGASISLLNEKLNSGFIIEFDSDIDRKYIIMDNHPLVKMVSGVVKVRSGRVRSGSRNPWTSSPQTGKPCKEVIKEMLSVRNDSRLIEWRDPNTIKHWISKYCQQEDS